MRLCPTVTIDIHPLFLDELPKQTIDSCISRSEYRWIAGKIYCGRQWPSIYISHNLLWTAMATDRHAAQSIVAGNDHRSNCTLHSLLWPAMAIDGRDSLSMVFNNYQSIDRQYHPAIDADNIYRYIYLQQSIVAYNTHRQIPPPLLQLKQYYRQLLCLCPECGHSHWYIGLPVIFIGP